MTNNKDYKKLKNIIVRNTSYKTIFSSIKDFYFDEMNVIFSYTLDIF